MNVEFNTLHPMVVDLKSRIQTIYEKDYTLPRSLHLIHNDLMSCVQMIEEYLFECRQKDVAEWVQGNASWRGSSFGGDGNAD